MPPAPPAATRFPAFARGVLGYMLLVVLWGAYVRATGSGAGCGDHWPRCDGQVVPRMASAEMMVEYTHRLTSAAAGLLVIAMVAWAFRAYAKGHPARGASVASLVLILTEGALGAGLVKLELVAQNQSAFRAFAMAAHLVNTFFLLAALTMVVWYADGGARPRLRGQGAAGWLLGAAVGLTILVGVSGAATALGDTLFPAKSLAEGLRQDVSPGAHFLVRLRLLHPTLAVLTGIYVVAAGWAVRRLRPDARTERLAKTLTALFVTQVAVGLVNVALLAPVWMQLVHLLLADAVWIALILTAAAALSAAPATAGGVEREGARVAPQPAA